jgi:hypothetical protein
MVAAPPRRPAARVWPEQDAVTGLDPDDLASSELEASSRGWSEDIEADDLAGR